MDACVQLRRDHLQLINGTDSQRDVVQANFLLVIRIEFPARWGEEQQRIAPRYT